MKEIDVEQGTPEWLKHRMGSVTGTSLKQAVSKNNLPLMYEIIADRMTEPEYKEINTDAVKRGKELEPMAIKRYSEHSGIKFETIGMMACDSISSFCISPDAVHRNSDGVIIGGLETKCPSRKKHVEYLIKNRVPVEYKHQVYSPFIVSTDVQWWDFVSYDDRNYDRDLFHIRVNRQDIQEELNDIESGLIKFLKKTESYYQELIF